MPSPAARRRNNLRFKVNSYPWYRRYRARMRAGLERCRACGAAEDLTFDHLVPLSEGGFYIRANLTITCRSCNEERGTAGAGGLRSLADEEAEHGLPPWPEREGASPEVLALIEANERQHARKRALKAEREASAG